MFRFFFPLFLMSFSAGAFIENPNLFPLGEREAFVANTGVALAGSTGSVFYNPAGLASIRSAKLSMSANTYLLSKTDYAPLDNVDGKDLNFSASGFLAVPSALISVHRGETWTIAYSALVPEQRRVHEMADFETPNYNIEMTYASQAQFILLGISAGAPMETGYDVGVGCFLGNYTGTLDRSVVVSPKSGSGLTQKGFTSASLNLDVKGVLCNLGAQKDYGPRLRAGAGLRLPFIKLEGKGRYSSFTQSTAGATANTGIKKVEADYDIPLDFAAGVVLKAQENFQLLADAGYQFPVEYTPFEGSGGQVKTKGTLRWSLGTIYNWTDKTKVLGGLAFNPSAVVLNQAGDEKQDFTVATLGVELTEKIATTGIGVFAARSTGETMLSTTRNGSVSSQAYGLLLTAGFAY